MPSIESRIKSEYQESPSQVIKGYAVMGYSQKVTAELLGINYRTLRAMVKRYKLRQYFKPWWRLNDSCKIKRINWENKLLIGYAITQLKRLTDAKKPAIYN